MMVTCNPLDILSNKKVLCVEDEAIILSNIMESLELFFGKVVGVKDGREALDEALGNLYDVLMLDISIPYIDGLDVVKKIRQVNKKIPIIILSAHSEQEYLWRAVELKITRYLCKPYDKNSLIKALEDVALELVEHQPCVQIMPSCVYDYCRKTITANEQILHLSKSESRLLEYFLKRPNQTITYEQLFEYMWEFEQPSKEALKSIVKELRKKIHSDFIKNLYGVGYLCEIQI
ncbi:response regulator with CheY-like receiver domain and winged-helix DNA-binding domain [Sulfurospirillum barnesii SES-3]|uniref:Response regulator with CheY-like receiver domain and winged-helix DNA-binding domain n=2 Tax=Sulfurospirillum barnesii TaxID=44674 RepID=I3XVV2_SULBS|nr:response regulator with CheY-like receiver domain and winged-helix DNA-binding domain [Sulfurospirillum barnesii SES-3]